MTEDAARLRPLIDRLARLSLSEDRADDLNPPQRVALRYLARANRFSRAPSHVAEYLGATRGTVSQTLASLLRKGMLREARSDTDRRRVDLELTDEGRAAVGGPQGLDRDLAALPPAEAAALERALSTLLTGMLQRRGSRPFGLCEHCRYHEPAEHGARCALLGVALRPEEALQVCHEQLPA